MNTANTRPASYDTVLFDLDGTLTNPATGITNAIRHALAKRNIFVDDPTTLYPFIGPPLIESFMRFYSFTLPEAQQALLDYREYFSAKGLFENEVLPGAIEMLTRLREAGCHLLVATSKPELYSRQILEHFNLMAFFEGVHGATLDEKRNRKEDVIAWALARTPNVRHAVMVGDRHHDIDGARANSIDSIGVLCGFGSEEELRTAGATYIAPTLADVTELVLGQPPQSARNTSPFR